MFFRSLGLKIFPEILETHLEPKFIASGVDHVLVIRFSLLIHR